MLRRRESIIIRVALGESKQNFSRDVYRLLCTSTVFLTAGNAAAFFATSDMLQYYSWDVRNHVVIWFYQESLYVSLAVS